MRKLQINMQTRCLFCFIISLYSPRCHANTLTQIRSWQRDECTFSQRCLRLSALRRSPRTCGEMSKTRLDKRDEAVSLHTRSVGSRLLQTAAANRPILDYSLVLLDAKELVRAILQNWHILDRPVAIVSGRKFYRSK